MSAFRVAWSTICAPTRVTVTVSPIWQVRGRSECVSRRTPLTVALNAPFAALVIEYHAPDTVTGSLNVTVIGSCLGDIGVALCRCGTHQCQCDRRCRHGRCADGEIVDAPVGRALCGGARPRVPVDPECDTATRSAGHGRREDLVLEGVDTVV